VLVSQDVLAEVERNLGRKAPEVLIAYRQLMFLIDAEVVPDPSPKEIHQAEAYVAQKDAMIVAAAISSRPDYLVTYDRKHLLDPPEVAERSGLVIVTPDVVVQVVREEEGDENEK
jgi:predicted nucleic acid-binding protein